MPDRSPQLVAGVVDRHVHLGLVDPQRLVGGPVVEVHDLGWIPEESRARRATPPAGVVVRIAGAFLMPTGGYPGGRSWAPDAAVREVGDVAAARAAVADAAEHRHDFVKVALHMGSAPFGAGVLEALVAGAHEAGLPVVAHVEGRGTAAVALRVGVDVLAHTPWTERLPQRLLERMAGSMEWISTLALHSGSARRTALRNASRFVAAGGRLRYGTDTGNGPAPAGLRADEVVALGEAGLRGAALLEALSGEPGGRPGERGAVGGPGPVPEHAPELAAWLQDARPVPTTGAAA